MAENIQPVPEQHGSLFRAEAIKRFNSPEQLDQRIHLIPPAMEVMAASATVILLAGLIWSVFGHIATGVTGQGVLLANGEAVRPVQAAISGPVIALLVKRGDPVEADAVIARIERVALDAQLASNRARIGALQDDLERLKKADAAKLANSDAIYRRWVAAVEDQISTAKQRAERLKAIASTQESLAGKRPIDQTGSADVQTQYDQAMFDVANTTAHKVELEVAAQQRRDDLAETERQKQADIDVLQAEATRLLREIDAGSTVKAPVAGTIAEIRVGRGDVVSRGTVLATIDQGAPQSFEIVAAFSNHMAKRVAPGMDVHIRPASVKKEEHGSMRGRVLSITDFGASKAELDSILHNAELTNSRMGDSAPLLARIEVFLDKSTPSGFAWWSGQGPPYAVTRGTRVSVDVIVSRQAPITLVIPALRYMLGLEG